MLRLSARNGDVPATSGEAVSVAHLRVSTFEYPYSWLEQRTLIVRVDVYAVDGGFIGEVSSMDSRSIQAGFKSVVGPWRSTMLGAGVASMHAFRSDCPVLDLDR